MKRRDFIKLSAAAVLGGAAAACGVAPAASASSVQAASPAPSAGSAQPGKLRRSGHGLPHHQRGGRHRSDGPAAPDPGCSRPCGLFHPGNQRGGAGAGL